MGCVNSDRLMALRSVSSKLKWAKLVTGLGADAPDTLTFNFCCRSITWMPARVAMSGCSL